VTGSGRGARRAPWRRTGAALVALLCVATSVGASAQQSDTLRAAALRVAQTRPDSARAMMRRLLASLSPQDSLYPGVLFTAGMLAPDAGLIATDLQRVVVEYGRSVWADSALLALTKLYFAQGDPAATLQAAERLRRDYPDSPLRPRADFTAARAAFDMKDGARGCTLIREALDGAGADLEFRNQVSYYAARCPSAPAAPAGATATPGAPGTPGAAAAPPPGTAAPAGDSQTKPPVAATPPSAYAVQVLAVKSATQVDEMLTRLKVMGFDARVVRDTSGLFKVRVGRFATREEALHTQRRLKTRLGGQPFVVEQP
jgi:cell division septation protein DedD